MTPQNLILPTDRAKIEKLRLVKQVFYHASCPDGTAAAIIIKSAFRGIGEPKFHSLQYDTDFMDKIEPREGQLFVDITPPKTRWEEWKPFEPIVLDHHETVEHVVRGLGGTYETNERHSGAMLAYEEILLPLSKAGIGSFSSTELEEFRSFAECAMIRDTWKKDHELWRKACAQGLAVQFHGSRPLIEKMNREPFDFDGIYELGEMLQVNSDRRTELTANGASHDTVSDGEKTYKVAFFNSTEKVISDAANYLVDRGVDIAIGYFYLFEDGQQKMSVSIRTNGSVSASSIAKTFGGGGHHRAAGFRISNANSAPPGVLLSYVEQGVLSARQ